MNHNFDKTREHQHGKRQQVQPSQRLWQSLIVACQTAKSCRPSETALHHPAPWQQHKAFLRLWQFHHFQADAVLLRRLCGGLARLALINKRHFDYFSDGLLHRLGQLRYLLAILLISRRDDQRQQVSEGIDSNYVLLPLRRLAPS
jgi:hypothetical protein